MTDGRRAPHPANELNELTGEEWLYFTKSVRTTAYPSELGHALRKAHGANKPPRLMARLIEFFSRSGELVLDPFAGVGGTLLGAAIARGPRRAIGIELDPRWAAVYARGRRRPRGGARRPRTGHRRPGHVRPGRPARRSTRPALELRVGDALALLPDIPDGSIDFVATDPPYNIQLPMTMAGGVAGRDARQPADRLRDGQRRPGGPRQRARLRRRSSTGWARVFGELAPGPARRAATRSSSCATPTRTAATSSSGRTWRPGPTRRGLVPKGDLIWHQAGTRLRPYGYPRVFVPNIAHQHILVLRREPARRQARRRLSR